MNQSGLTKATKRMKSELTVLRSTEMGYVSAAESTKKPTAMPKCVDSELRCNVNGPRVMLKRFIE
jgi:hypothetical protein